MYSKLKDISYCSNGGGNVWGVYVVRAEFCVVMLYGGRNIFKSLCVVHTGNEAHSSLSVSLLYMEQQSFSFQTVYSHDAFLCKNPKHFKANVSRGRACSHITPHAEDILNHRKGLFRKQVRKYSFYSGIYQESAFDPQITNNANRLPLRYHIQLYWM